LFNTTSLLAAAVMAAGMAVAAPAAAQTYPERPITMIVPFSPGGSTDLIARIVIEKASATLGQPIVIENKPGAGTQVGLNELAASKPDGYTLGMATSSAVLQPIYGGTRFNYPDVLQPLAQFAETAPILAVRADAEWSTLEEMLAFAKDNPGAVKYGITGVGNSSHLGPASVALEADVDMPHVVFDGGAPLMTALLGGHIAAAAGSPVDYKEQIAAGELKGLVSFAAQRSDDPLLSEIPTALELGYDAEITSWTAVAGPQGMPEDVVATLEAAFAEAMADSAVQQAIDELGSDPIYLDAEGLGTRWENARKSWTAIVTDTGILELVQSQTN
jgi:tripartite-type tricarboxylate transporter receptor subunit TctC